MVRMVGGRGARERPPTVCGGGLMARLWRSDGALVAV